MKKGLIIALALAFSVCAQVKNWGGYLDTTIIWISDTTTVKYGKTYVLTELVNLNLVTMANDTTAAGLSADSTSLLYGYQVGGEVINASGLKDTAWAGHDTLDTMSNITYGKTCGNGRYSLSTDLLTETWGQADTSRVTGYAYQIRPVRPYNWDMFIRSWYIGKTGTRLAKPNKVVSLWRKQIGIPTVAK